MEINIVDSHTKRFILVDEGLSLNERDNLIGKINKDKELFYKEVFRLAQPEIDNINPSLPYHIREQLRDEIYNKKAKLLMPKYEKHLMKILDSTSKYNMYVHEIRRA